MKCPGYEEESYELSSHTALKRSQQEAGQTGANKDEHTSRETLEVEPKRTLREKKIYEMADESTREDQRGTTQ